MDSEEVTEQNAIATNIMGMHYVRPPILDFNKLKETNKYTGTEIIGIGTMHKSNMVPVSRKKDAEDMAKMRR